MDSIVPKLLIENIEMIAKKIHEMYNEKQLMKFPGELLKYPNWDSLPETLKHSNIRQAKDIVDKLKKINCYIAEYSDDKQIDKFTEMQIEYLAKIEHDSWMAERQNNGWVYGHEKNVKKKTSPYIVPYEKLTDDIKEYDREAARNIIPLLKAMNVNIYEIKKSQN